MGNIANPGESGVELVVAETEVFAANSPGASAWTDLDLSAVVGLRKTLVLLKFNGDLGDGAVRTNGDTDEFYNAIAPSGTQLVEVVAAVHIGVLVTTDANGIVEWRSALTSQPVTIDIMAYLQ